MTRRLLAATLALLVLSAASELEAGQRRALLIGINNYIEGPDYWDLRGCVNDVDMTRQMLTGRLGFDESDVRILVDGDATAQNIREAIETWVMPASGPDDLVYIHYSGHGSRINDTGGDEADGWDEMLCPADLKASDRSTLLLDDELGALLERITAGQVITVLDACHSGTGTRDLSMVTPRFLDLGSETDGSRAVAVAGAPSTAPDGDYIDTPLRADVGEGSPAGGQQVRVTFSGCRADQTSADAWIEEGFYAGAFTYNLMQNIQKAPAGVTYRDLMESVRRDMAGRYHQIPQIEGDLDMPLFGLTKISGQTVPSVPVLQVEGGAVTLGAGHAHGVTIGSVYRIYPPGAALYKGDGLGTVEVTSVRGSSSLAATQVDLGIEAGCRAREIQHQTPQAGLQVKVTGEADAGALAAALEAIPFVSVAAPSHHHDLQVEVAQAAASEGGGILVARVLQDGQQRASVSAPAPATLAGLLRPHLANAYLVKQLGKLDNPSPDFGVKVWACHTGPGAADVVEALSQAPEQRYARARIGDVVQFGFTAEQDCYLTMINVGTSGKVTVLFPNKYRPDGRVEAGVVYQTETPGDMPFRIRAVGPPGRELVKVVATLEPLDLSSLEMGEAGGAGTRSIADGVGFTAQLQRDLVGVATVGGSEPSGSMKPGLIPTAGWATDYLILDTYK